MNIRGPAEKRADLRAALIEAAAKPWSVDLERSAEVARNAVTWAWQAKRNLNIIRNEAL